MVEGLLAHRVSNALWVLRCSCRHSKCFKHMLEKDGIHSAEAILAHRKSKDHSYWHKLHTDRRTQDVRNAKSMRSIMSTGSRWSCRERLTVAALYYGKCNPLSRSMKRGWYDVEVSQDGDGRLPLPETHMTSKPSVWESSRAAGTKRLRPVVELRTRKKVRLTISDHSNLQQRDSEPEDTQHHPDDDDEKIASNYGDDLARTINMANTRPMVTAGAENQRHQRIMSSEPPEAIPVAAESSSTQPQASAVGARLRGRGGRPPGIPITKSTDTSPSAPVDKGHIGNDSSRRDETSPPEDIMMELSSSKPLAVNPTPGSSDVKTAPSVEDFEHVTTQYALYIKVMTDFKCRIESLEGEVRGKEKQLKRVNDEFAQERDRLERQTSLLQQKTDQVLDLQAHLKEKDQELTDELLQRTSQLSEKERLLLEKEKHNEQRALEKDSQVSAREHQLQEIEHQLLEKEHQLQEKDHQLQEKERQLREDEHQLREKEHQLREEEHQLREKEHQLQEKDNKLQEEEHQLRERERTIAIQTQQKDEQHEQIAAQPQPEAPPQITQDQGRIQSNPPYPHLPQ
ncbi:hypothetical protein WOLCODRAFT_15704 [Wolfiporia cocos MD-104 SS10]|uniref:Uncharacterized protein n=1 Tax=Wolfiporia cocos (strain MD-104) TaxID=742152 RepID=A0A2H3J8C3_WOLCO|nr:hypothetical protein WOLCODRAFT_15704 [Wolfiporia cocos MD-104 SS10]